MAQLQHDSDRYNLAPKKFNMWIFIFTSFMFFAALTSGFIVYSGGKGHALNMIMPQAFKYSTLLILLSSGTFFLASQAAKRSDIAKQRMFLWLTCALGIGFLAMQIYGFDVMAFQMHAFFINNNASVSFVYVFVASHLVHILAGLGLLLNALYTSYRKAPQVINLYKMEMSSIFWHFIDIVWIYLYVFLLLKQY